MENFMEIHCNNH